MGVVTNLQAALKKCFVACFQLCLFFVSACAGSSSVVLLLILEEWDLLLCFALSRFDLFENWLRLDLRSWKVR